jgi:hypothetical protein
MRTGPPSPTCRRWMAQAMVASMLLGACGSSVPPPSSSPGPPSASAIPTATPAATALPSVVDVGTAAPQPSPSADPALGVWRRGTSLPSPRAETTAIALDSRIYIPGGLDQLGVGAAGPARSLASMLIYDPAADTYTDAADMPGARDHLGIASWKGRIYVSGGGMFGGPTVRDNLWAYDPATDAWSVLPPMPHARWQHAMVAIDGKLVRGRRCHRRRHRRDAGVGLRHQGASVEHARGTFADQA